jgi:hypothetical protein
MIPHFLDAWFVLQDENILKVSLAFVLEVTEESCTTFVQADSERVFNLVGVFTDIDTAGLVEVILGVDETVVWFVELDVDGHHFLAAVHGHGVNVRRVAVVIIVRSGGNKVGN